MRPELHIKTRSRELVSKILPRLLLYGTDTLLHMLAVCIHIRGTWPHALWADVLIMYETHPKLSTWPDPRNHADFVCFLKEHPDAWREVVRSFAFQGCLASQPKLCVSSSGDFACPDCPKVCTSAQSLAAHRFAVHKVVNPARAYAHGTHCKACLVEFWERPRLAMHLKATNSKCFPALSCNITPLSSVFA